MLKVPTMLRPHNPFCFCLDQAQTTSLALTTIIITSTTIAIITTIRQHLFSPPTISTDQQTNLRCALNTRLSSRFQLHHFHHHHHRKHVKCGRCVKNALPFLSYLTTPVNFNILSKLPRSNCVVFAIHSYIDPLTSLTESPRAAEMIARYRNNLRESHLCKQRTLSYIITHLRCSMQYF